MGGPCACVYVCPPCPRKTHCDDFNALCIITLYILYIYKYVHIYICSVYRYIYIYTIGTVPSYVCTYFVRREYRGSRNERSDNASLSMEIRRTLGLSWRHSDSRDSTETRTLFLRDKRVASDDPNRSGIKMNSRNPLSYRLSPLFSSRAWTPERGAIKSAQRDGQVAVRPENVRRLKAVADFGEAREENSL